MNMPTIITERVLQMIVVVVWILNISAEEPTKGPIVIFHPGEFFDPFTEESFRDSKPSGSAIPQPNLIFGEPRSIFGQNFRQLAHQQATPGYPRAIGLTSGTTEQFNAQLWQPQTFFNEFAKYEAKQPKPQPFVASKPVITYSEKRVDPNKKILSADVKLIPQPFKKSDASVKNGIGETGEASYVVPHRESYNQDHAASKSAGEGRSHAANHHLDHGDQEAKGYRSDHHHSTRDHGNHLDHHKESHNKEKGGHNSAYHDEAGHYRKHHEGKKSHKAAKFGEKKGHKRGHKTKGYHNKFHRDEYHREHRFYDDYHKEGYHEKHGDDHSHYKKKEGGHKHGGGHKSGQSSKKHGKKGFDKKGHHIDDNKGFSREGGRKKYYKHHRDHGRKHGNAHGRKYGHQSEH